MVQQLCTHDFIIIYSSPYAIFMIFGNISIAEQCNGWLPIQTDRTNDCIDVITYWSMEFPELLVD